MEKFSTWRDAGTGIQPFLPIKPPSSGNDLKDLLPIYLKTFLLQPLIFLIKLPFILVLGAITLLIQNLTDLIPNSSFKQTVKLVLLSPLIRACLFLFGFFNIESQLGTLRKGRSSRSSGNYTKPTHGDVIICNFSSYIDILYLWFKYQPTFTRCYINQSKLKIVSISELIKSCELPTEYNSSDLTFNLEDLIKKCKNESLGPIVLFPEGVTSNGRALLKFHPVFNQLKLVPKTYLVHLKYKFDYFSPTFPCGSKWVHFYQLCSQVYNQLNIQYLTSEEIESNFKNQSMIRFPDYIKDQMIEFSRLRQTSIGEKEKVEFLKFFNSKKSSKFN